MKRSTTWIRRQIMNAHLKQMAQKGRIDQINEINELKSWMTANK